MLIKCQMIFLDRKIENLFILKKVFDFFHKLHEQESYKCLNNRCAIIDFGVM